jgi:hypothetical protein
MPSYAKTIIMGHVGTIKANYTQTGKKITRTQRRCWHGF